MDEPSSEPLNIGDSRGSIDPKSTEGNVLHESTLRYPLLKNIHKSAPPTPRDPSPLRVALDEIHPSKIPEDDNPISPTARKEEEIQLPTAICDFSAVTNDDEPQLVKKGNSLVENDN